MHSWTEVTQEELNEMSRHHRLFEYSNNDIAGLLNLVRKYITPHTQSCLSCAGGQKLYEFKKSLNEFYLANKEHIENKLNEVQVPSSLGRTDGFEKAGEIEKKTTKKKR